MATSRPQLVSLDPLVLDNRRVMFNLKTINLPGNPKGSVELNFSTRAAAQAYKRMPNVNFSFEAPTTPGSVPSEGQSPEDDRDLEEIINSSPYPNIEISLWDEAQREVAQIVIIEHQEQDVSLTLHIPQPQPGKSYTARAELIHHQEILDTLEASFVLSIAKIDSN